MTRPNCLEFDHWLELQPAADQSESFQRHLAECPRCAAEVDRLTPLLAVLAADSESDQVRPLARESVERLARATRNYARHREDRRINRNLGLVALSTLPLVVLVNWVWGSLGFSLIATTVSTAAASVFLAMFLTGVTSITGVLYASLPLIAGAIRGTSLEENSHE